MGKPKPNEIRDALQCAAMMCTFVAEGSEPRDTEVLLKASTILARKAKIVEAKIGGDHDAIEAI